MNARLRKLLEERATAWSKVQDIQARRSAAGYEETAEDGETFTRALDDVERLSKLIEDEERSARLATQLDELDPSQRSTNPGGAPDAGGSDAAELYQRAFEHYVRRGIGSLPADEQRALEQGFVAAGDTRALAAGVDAAGGYTVPDEFRNKMVEGLKAFGGILGLADVINTSSGNPLQWPTNDDTNNKGAILAENTQVTEQDLVFGTAALAAFMYTSKMVRVSIQLLQDSAFNLNTWLPRKLGERIGRAAAEHFAIGTGVGQPLGLVTGLTNTVDSGTTGKIGFDDLVNLEHAIDPAYRGGAGVGYVLADSALRELRKLKDTTGRPIWAPAVSLDAPSTINGRRYTIDNNLAAVAAGSKSVVFGDIKAAYVIRLVAGAQTLRLTERYADYLQVGFLGFQRMDATVQDASAAAALVTKAA